MKTCTRCLRSLELREFNKNKRSLDGHGWQCRGCVSEIYKRDFVQNRDTYRNREMRTKYGITLESYNLMLESQGGGCAICSKKPSQGKYGRLHIDHCHKTGKVRGLLCRECNTSLGKFKDDQDLLHRALHYLKIHSRCSIEPQY